MVRLGLLVLTACGTPDSGDTSPDEPDVPDLEAHLDAFVAANFPDELAYSVVSATLITADTDAAALGDVVADSTWVLGDDGFVPWTGIGRADHLAAVILPSLVADAVLVRLEWTLGESSVETWAIVAPGPHDVGDAIGYWEPITSTWRTPATASGTLLAWQDGWGTVRTRVTGGLACPDDASCTGDVVASDDVPGCFASASASEECVPNGKCEGDVSFVAWCGAPVVDDAGDYGRVWATATLPSSIDCGCGDTADFDADGVTLADGDCDDDDATIKPGAAEQCDLLDSDCDESVADEFPDLEGDDLPDCADPDDDGDGALDAVDCAPTDSAIGQGLPESCDAIDSDCDLDLVDGFPNFDNDTQPDCTDPDDDDDGSPDDVDCDDFDVNVRPGATEACDDKDSDCDGSLVDTFTNTDGDAEPNCIDGDDDGDGSLDQNDCNDTNSAIRPGATESCDLVDSDCDGSLIDGAANGDGDTQPDCVDTDDDNDGDPDTTDCDDRTPAIRAGAVESCDSVDSDCDGSLVDGFTNTDGDSEPNCVDTDDDNDGDPDTTDCNDANDDIYTNAPETCADFVDQDCDNVLDDGCYWLDHDNSFWLPARGGSGGTLFEDHCPEGYVAVGLEGNVGQYVDRVRMVCRLLWVDGDPIGPTSTTTYRGGSGGTPDTDASCATDLVFGGQYVERIGSFVHRVGGWCLDHDFDPPADFLAMLGGTPLSADAYYSERCDAYPTADPNAAGYAVTAIAGASGGVLDKVQMYCTPIRDHH